MQSYGRGISPILPMLISLPHHWQKVESLGIGSVICNVPLFRIAATNAD